MGYPVILIHGMWVTGEAFKRVATLMKARGYDCVAPSLPAHDASPDQPLKVGRLSLKDYLAALERCAAELPDGRPPIIIGHSMGGLLAQQLAARISPLALVLLTPAPAAGIGLLPRRNIGAFMPWMLRRPFWREAYKPAFARAQRYAFRGLPEDRHRATYEGMVHESGRAIFEIGLWPLDRQHAAAVTPQQVRCPVYVVSAGRDWLTPADQVRKTARLYPQATLRHYPDRAHWVIDDEDTEEMVHSICGWLRPIEQKQARHGTA
ncbi:Lysophospholipase, alpha-beta hydrolase superfamily [Solimonas aquatica]|uniref:Lysophospholipase, alpha-beta hydrolase superfamily n=1 Tax=Solimonas aquatica TaxID=489703 RepID=A0A1H9HYU5_9GAMM|nr:alpha/beta fold hydrolase [Solimonas aquatica]SEQ67488.1 Lysophospholipase, alpha-beta hydrolase superfamily [Solimonas aquatica]